MKAPDSFHLVVADENSEHFSPVLVCLFLSFKSKHLKFIHIAVQRVVLRLHQVGKSATSPSFNALACVIY